MILSKPNLAHYLEQLTKKGLVVWYTELYEYFCIPTDDYLTKNKPIHLLLNKLVQEDSEAKRPLRASVVVGKEKNRDRSKPIQKDAYFKALCEIKGIPIPNKKEEKQQLHRLQMEALINHYGPQ